MESLRLRRRPSRLRAPPPARPPAAAGDPRRSLPRITRRRRRRLTPRATSSLPLCRPRGRGSARLGAAVPRPYWRAGASCWPPPAAKRPPLRPRPRHLRQQQQRRRRRRQKEQQQPVALQRQLQQRQRQRQRQRHPGSMPSRLPWTPRCPLLSWAAAPAPASRACSRRRRG